MKKSTKIQIKNSSTKKFYKSLRFLNVCLLVAVIGTTLTVLSQAAPAPGEYGSIEKDQLNRINAARKANGVQPISLIHVQCVYTVARDWTSKMASSNYLAHNPNFASQIGSRCGGSWSTLAENVGVAGDSAQMFNALMNSPSHRANILNPNFTRVGIGAFYDNNGRLWVTQNFANCSNCSGGWNTTASVPSDPITYSPPSSVTYKVKNGDRLVAGESITRGTTIYSSQKKFRLVFQQDGNLVVYNMATGGAVWSSRTNYNNGSAYGIKTVLQGDGNFVVYRNDGKACNSRTYGKGGRSLIMQNDGNLVLYTSANKAVWSTRYNTWYC